PRFFLAPLNSAARDYDHDGLADVVEFVYGTNPAVSDSDGDGIRDGAEVDQGISPRDQRPTPTGIVASSATPGEVTDVCAINAVAIVANVTAGISVFNVVNGQNPVRVAQVPTPGPALAVSCSGNLIAVAMDSAGLAVVNISDPPAARIIHQIQL